MTSTLYYYYYYYYHHHHHYHHQQQKQTGFNKMQFITSSKLLHVSVLLLLLLSSSTTTTGFNKMQFITSSKLLHVSVPCCHHQGVLKQINISPKRWSKHYTAHTGMFTMLKTLKIYGKLISIKITVLCYQNYMIANSSKYTSKSVVVYDLYEVCIQTPVSVWCGAKGSRQHVTCVVRHVGRCSDAHGCPQTYWA